jgi:hypothetical protein
MLFQPTSGPGASYLAIQVVDFPGLLAARRWEHATRAELSGDATFAFGRSMASFGSRDSGGFGAGCPALGRRVVVTAWRSRERMEQHLGAGVGCANGASPARGWWLATDVRGARGTHRGEQPLATGSREGTGVMVALTLGRSRARMLPAFIREGARVGAGLPSAPGVISAISAGLPFTGNCTVSLWEDESAMLAFAYGAARDHVHVARRRNPILRDQINARLSPLALGGDLASAPLHPERLEALRATLRRSPGITLL